MAIRGDTPTYRLLVEGYDITACTVHVALTDARGRKTEKVVTGMVADEEGTHIALYLTQEETLAMRQGRAEVQVTWVDSEGDRRHTEIKTVVIGRTLMPEVISYE